MTTNHHANSDHGMRTNLFNSLAETASREAPHKQTHALAHARFLGHLTDDPIACCACIAW